MFFRTSKNVKNIFNNVSYKYDFLNNLLSFGLHNLWKRELVSLANPSAGENWGDLCCGTGDISFIINKMTIYDLHNYIAIIISKM